MKRNLGTFAFCAFLVWGAAARAQSPLFLLDSEVIGQPGDSTNIYRVTASTGQLTLIGGLPTSLSEGIGLAAVDANLLYMTTSSGRLVRITVSPFGFTDLGTISPFVYVPGLAYFNGQLYGVAENTNGLYRIDPSGPTATLIGTIRLGAGGPAVTIDGGDIALDSGGNLYLWTNTPSDLFLVNLTTAVATQLDPVSQNLVAKSGIAFDYLAGGLLYGSTRPNDAFERLNLTTGQTVASVPACLNGPCPPPFDLRFGDMASPPCSDVDGDGFSPEGGLCGPVDCNANNPNVRPGAVEICNAIDDNCNSSIDENPAADASCVTACTATAQCIAGSCETTPIPCNDSNLCTTDSCNPQTGCVFTPVSNGISCSDGNLCNGLELCQGGSCAGGTALNCNDGNGCTVDGCSASTGCTAVPIPGCCSTNADCADSSACTTNERCLNSTCTSDPLVCNDSNPCTMDSCNPSAPALEACVFTPVPNGQSCSDTDFCDGIETCQNGACAVGGTPDCNDGNPCTTDSCNSMTGCSHLPVSGCCFTDGDCVDTDACTINHRCMTGLCTSEARNCEDANPCTLDSCNPQTGCQHTSLIDGAGCSDSNACDGDELCTAGQCGEGSPPDCDDRNFCSTDSCNNGSGCQHAPVANCCNTDGDCADADQCTINERCTGQSICVSDTRICNDANTCTTDSCNPASGCVFTAVAPTACDDGSLCTVGDACAGGSCGAIPMTCDDGNLCNGGEACVPQTGLCATPSQPSQCTPGSKRASRTCYAEWHITNPNNPGGAASSTQECMEGDPSCDADEDSGTCTFSVALCFRVPDPRLIPACPLEDVALYRLKKPNVRRDSATASALMAALDALPGSTVDTQRGRDVTFDPPLNAVTCTAAVPISVEVGSRKVLRGQTKTVTGSKDNDPIVRLKCHAP